MSQNLGVTLITIGGLAGMGVISVVFIKTIINTTKYADKKNEHN